MYNLIMCIKKGKTIENIPYDSDINIRLEKA